MILLLTISFNVNALDGNTKCSSLSSLTPFENGYVLGLLAGARIYGGGRCCWRSYIRYSSYNILHRNTCEDV